MSIHHFLDRWFTKREIRDCDGSIYMHRWFIFRTNPVAIFVHKFVRSDFERAIHDHPWSFLVIPLWRGYIEHSEGRCGWCRSYTSECICGEWGIPGKTGPAIPNSRRVYPLLGIRFRRAEFRHRVELFTNAKGEQLPSWSIFIRFRKRRLWGFWFPTGWQEAMEWWQQHCADTPEMVGHKPEEVKLNKMETKTTII